MATLEAHSKADALQGKNPVTISGRYNATDTIISALELRWPNEGYHAVGGGKSPLYDDIMMQEWVAGQLSNIYYMQDPTLVKQALLQVMQLSFLGRQ